MTKLHNKNGLSKFQRYEIANHALTKAVTVKPVITVLTVNKYLTIVQVFYLEDEVKKSALIKIEWLENYITANTGNLPQPGIIDMNLSDYLEENLHPVCASYLEDGKELMP